VFTAGNRTGRTMESNFHLNMVRNISIKMPEISGIYNFYACTSAILSLTLSATSEALLAKPANLSFDESNRSAKKSETFSFRSLLESEDNANAMVAPNAAPANTPTIIFVSFFMVLVI